MAIFNMIIFDLQMFTAKNFPLEDIIIVGEPSPRFSKCVSVTQLEEKVSGCYFFNCKVTAK